MNLEVGIMQLPTFVSRYVFPLTVIFSLLAADLCFAQAEEGAELMVPVDYAAMINEIVGAYRSEELNAAPSYKKAFDLYVERPDELKKMDPQTWPANLSSQQHTALKEWLRQNSPALDELKKGAEKPCCWFSYEGSSMWEVTPQHLLKARSLAYALCLRAKTKAAQGKFEDSSSDLLLSYKFGTHWSAPKPVVQQLARAAIFASTASAAFQILEKTNPPSDSLKQFQDQLQKLTADQAHIVDFTIERIVMHENAQRMFTDYSTGLPKISATQLAAIKRMLNLNEQQMQNLRQADGPNTIGIANKVYDYLDKTARKTPAQLHEEKQNINETVRQIIKDNAFVPIFLPPADRFTELSWRSKAATDALITTLAILRYKTDKGKLPDKLDLLVSKGYLKQLPMDPYSDKPLVYKKTGDNFTLYSLGADFDDNSGIPGNGGQGQKGGDMLFWPTEGQKESMDKKQVTNARTDTQKELQ
jgi:hypothetical protein